MADPTATSAVSIILEPISLIFSAIATAVTSIHYSWWASRIASLIASLVALPWKLLTIPFRIISAIVLTVLSPVLLILSYVLAIGAALGRLIASLEVGSSHIRSSQATCYIDMDARIDTPVL
jgi:hypothetical protein